MIKSETISIKKLSKLINGAIPLTTFDSMLTSSVMPLIKPEVSLTSPKTNLTNQLSSFTQGNASLTSQFFLLPRPPIGSNCRQIMAKPKEQPYRHERLEAGSLEQPGTVQLFLDIADRSDLHEILRERLVQIGGRRKCGSRWSSG